MKEKVRTPGSRHLLFTAVLLAALLTALYVTVPAYAADDKETDYRDNGIPVLYLTIDPDEFDKVNRSEYHTYKSAGGSIKIECPEGFRSDFSDEQLPETTGDLALEYVRGRGNSTWQEEKRPYKLKLDKKAELLGMGKNKHWVLLTNYDDDSLLKNRLVLYMGRMLGLKYTPKCVPVDFVVNGVYKGSYLLCEDVRIDKNRVDIDELSQQDIDGSEITGGYILALAPYDDPHKREPLRNVFHTDRLVRFKTDAPEFWSDDPDDQEKLGVKAQRDYIEDYVQKTEDAIFADDFKAEDGTLYSDLMDTESAAKYWWIQEFIENGDAFATPSTYLYKERNGKLFWGPLWDFDLTMDDLSDEEGVYHFDMSFSRSNMPWLNRLRGYNSEYQELLRETWKEYDAVLADMIKDGGVIDVMLAQIRKSWEDDKAYNVKMDYESTADREAGLLKKFIRDKRNWVNDNIDEKLDDSRVTVTFMADGKEIEKRDWVIRRPVLDPPEAPEIPGKTFIAWKEQEAEYKPGQELFIDGDKVFTAEYKDDSKLKRPEGLYFGDSDVWAEIHRKVFDMRFDVRPFTSDDMSVKWESSDPEIAQPLWDGSVKLKKTGDAVITGTIKTAKGSKSGSYTIHVFDAFDVGFGTLPEPETVKPEKTHMTLKPGQRTQIKLDAGTGPHANFANFYTDQYNVLDVEGGGVITALRPGKAVVKVDYDSGTVCEVTVTVSRYKNQMKARGKTIKVKASTLRKKSVKVSRKKIIKLSKAKAGMTYKKLKGNRKIRIDKKTGSLTIRKGIRKGTYKVRILLTSGDRNYAAKKVKVVVTVRVK